MQYKASEMLKEQRHPQKIQLKNAQRTWTDTSLRRTYRGPRVIWKDVQHHKPSERCKLKLQWGPISHQSERHHKQSNKQQVLERMRRKGNPAALFGGNAEWCTTVGNSMEFPQKMKNETAFWSSNSIAGIIPYEPWNTNPKDPVHPNVHSSTIYNSQVLEAT